MADDPVVNLMILFGFYRAVAELYFAVDGHMVCFLIGVGIGIYAYLSESYCDDNVWVVGLGYLVIHSTANGVDVSDLWDIFPFSSVFKDLYSKFKETKNSDHLVFAIALAIAMILWGGIGALAFWTSWKWDDPIVVGALIGYQVMQLLNIVGLVGAPGGVRGAAIAFRQLMQ
jgi:hypothetical protein